MTPDGAALRADEGASPDGSSSRDGSGDPEVWTVLRLIRWSGEYLAEKGVESGRLDAEHLLAHALQTERLQLYLQFDRPLNREELDRFRPLLRRRAAREPLQYILGSTGFRELELRCDRRALIPRPETEVLVERVLDWARGRENLTAVDVGTGTGCVALSLAVEGPFTTVWAVDRSGAALELARENAADCSGGEALRFVHGDGLSALQDGARVDVVVSNPPYVGTSERDALAPEILEHEPHEALFSGSDGMDLLRSLVPSAVDRLKGGGLLALEVGMDQGDRVLELISETGAFREAALHRDLTGRPRIVTAVRRDFGATH